MSQNYATGSDGIYINHSTPDLSFVMGGSGNYRWRRPGDAMFFTAPQKMSCPTACMNPHTTLPSGGNCQNFMNGTYSSWVAW
ncbi:hypothetical protein LAU_0279 [Lausannevirus]|uniref:Uncharacterized protein n=2 Tax=Lausannevirus TaxID=999883 RepID=A0A0N9P8X2_9VIRU|nr:hypothetical protein LAU_0279 [Lausannevirus]AEA07130.1 hypothetical protein LAU_0279 [Lausannevirus]ALH06948.1 hypothetical protein PMV_250 [Port-miou virus]